MHENAQRMWADRGQKMAADMSLLGANIWNHEHPDCC